MKTAIEHIERQIEQYALLSEMEMQGLELEGCVIFMKDKLPPCDFAILERSKYLISELNKCLSTLKERHEL